MQKDVRRAGLAPGAGLLLAIAYLGFISLGLPNPVAGVAWPSVRDTFDLEQSAFGLVFIGLGWGYVLSGFFGGKLSQMLGVGNLLWISSALVAVAMFGSGLAPAWPLFVACAVVWGLGSGGIDAGINAYASSHFPARHVNWLHACYNLGATLGPLLMTTMLIQAGSWRLGYGLVGGLLAAMTIAFALTRDRWNDPATSADHDGPASAPAGIIDTLRLPLVWLQIALFFVYVGLEFTVGQWAFTLLTESRGTPENLAGVLAAGYYAAIGVGRVLAGFASHRVGLDMLVRCATGTVLVGTLLLSIASPVEVGYLGLAIVGLGLAPIFPCLMARTPARLGSGVAAHAVGFQVSAGMIGVILLPGLAGLLAEHTGLEVIAQFAICLAILLLATHELLLAASKRPARSAK